MTKLAFLDYTFMFDPDSTWTNVYDFEDNLAEFFKINGYEAQRMEAVRGGMSRGIFFIAKVKKDLLDGPPNLPPTITKKT